MGGKGNKRRRAAVKGGRDPNNGCPKKESAPGDLVGPSDAPTVPTLPHMTRARSRSRPPSRRPSCPVSGSHLPLTSVCSAPPPLPPPPPTPEALRSPFRLPAAATTVPFSGRQTIVRCGATYPKTVRTSTVVIDQIAQETLSGSARNVWGRPSSTVLSREDCLKLEQAFEVKPPVCVKTKGRAEPESGFAVPLLDLRRRQNLGIALAKATRKNKESIEAFVETVLSADENMDSAPESELISNLKALQAQLPAANEMKNYAALIGRLVTACRCVQQNQGLVEIFHQCLQYANFLNQGSHSANALGFKLNSLTNLLNHKGSGKTRFVSLLTSNGNLVSSSSFLDLISPLDAVKKISVADLEKGVDSWLIQLANIRLEQESLMENDSCAISVRRYYDFYQEAQKAAHRLRADLVGIRMEERALKEYLCAENMNLEEVFSTIREAALCFQTACQAQVAVKVQKVEQRFAVPLPKCTELRSRALKPKNTNNNNNIHSTDRCRKNSHDNNKICSSNDCNTDRSRNDDVISSNKNNSNNNSNNNNNSSSSSKNNNSNNNGHAVMGNSLGRRRIPIRALDLSAIGISSLPPQQSSDRADDATAVVATKPNSALCNGNANLDSNISTNHNINSSDVSTNVADNCAAPREELMQHIEKLGEQQSACLIS